MGAQIPVTSQPHTQIPNPMSSQGLGGWQSACANGSGQQCVNNNAGAYPVLTTLLAIITEYSYITAAVRRGHLWEDIIMSPRSGP